MTDQYSDNVPADFDAFSAPASRYPAGYDAYPDPTLSFEAVSPETNAVRGFKSRYASMGKAKPALGILAVMLVAGAGTWAASAAFASPASSSSASANPPIFPGATSSKSGARGDRNANKAARVTITQLGTGSFTGTDARGQAVTVVYSGTTRFGSKVRPLSPDQLVAGMTVTVLGPRNGNSIDATAVGVPAKTDVIGGGSPPSATPGELNG
jgi:hypothetical protein